jgi:hypothetical protein
MKKEFFKKKKLKKDEMKNEMKYKKKIIIKIYIQKYKFKKFGCSALCTESKFVSHNLYFLFFFW